MAKEVLFHDDFSQGFLEGKKTGSMWKVFKMGPVKADDGIVTVKDNVLHVVPKGVNHETGLPAFSGTASKGMMGKNDHMKWNCNAQYKSGRKSGVELVSGKTLVVEAVIGVNSFGMENHPFGSLVEDPKGDPRLGAGVLVTQDLPTMTIFDFFVTENQIFAVYERAELLRLFKGRYASFSFAVPIASHKKGDFNTLSLKFNKEKNTVQWYVDGEMKYELLKPGCIIDRQYMLIDNGGKDTIINLTRINAALGMFSLMDGARKGTGLVNLSGSKGFFNPQVGEPQPPVFFDEESKKESRLFGQGVELMCKDFSIYYEDY